MRERAPEVRVVISTPGGTVVTMMGVKKKKEILNAGCREGNTLVEEKVPHVRT